MLCGVGICLRSGGGLIQPRRKDERKNAKGMRSEWAGGACELSECSCLPGCRSCKTKESQVPRESC